MDWADEKAQQLTGPIKGRGHYRDSDETDIAAALRQARGDIAGEVCPHWTVEKARLVEKALASLADDIERRQPREHYSRNEPNSQIEEADSLRSELDMLIQQAEAKEGRDEAATR